MSEDLFNIPLTLENLLVSFLRFLPSLIAALVIFVLGLVLAVSLLIISHLLGKRGATSPVKDSPYECGIEAEGEAAAIYAKLEAEARGQYEILQKKGLGFAEIVNACGDAQSAFQMLMLEHMDQLSENAAKAISNIKFDKIVVWDGGANGSGKSATSGFLSGLSQSLPPMLNMMRDIGGVDMPNYFGKLIDTKKDEETPDEPKAPEQAA